MAQEQPEPVQRLRGGGFCGDCVPLRNSRDPDGPVLVFTAPEWDAFVEGVKRGEFDRPRS